MCCRMQATGHLDELALALENTPEWWTPNLVLFWQLRREKISERMKLLQDLVPGCTKVSLLTARTTILTFLKSELLKNNDTFFGPGWVWIDLGHWEGGDAGRDHQLCPVPAKTSGGMHGSSSILILKVSLSHLTKAMYWPNDSRCISQFLSMKLAAVNPQLGLNIKQLLSKDVSNLLTHLQFFLVLFSF